MTIFVIKVDGSTESFDRRKVVRTCIRMGASEEIAETIAKKIEEKIYDGIESRKILQMIFSSMRRYRPICRHIIDLRKSLSLIKSKPDFEFYIQELFREYGYTVLSNQIIQGKCVEHEVDALIKKDGKTTIVEVKHHSDYHKPTGLDEARIARAVYEDVKEGFENGSNDLKIDHVMIISNTKLSEHAKRYVKCRKIGHIGWSYPRHYDLQTMIEEKKLYPVSIMRGLKTQVRESLASNGIVMIKQLLKMNPEELRRKTRISKKDSIFVINKVKTIHECN
ncbi:ATP cone domain-containing protein [[Eubacterium] cellulosolvens]